MNLFLHLCCGPCTIYPVNFFREKSYNIQGFFYNPNIHPYQEYERRLLTLKQYALSINLNVIYEESYGIREFVRKVAFHEDSRCEICYYMRLHKAALTAKKEGFDCFSTTLLYSKYQRHSTIIEMCENISQETNVPFLYEDLRVGWQDGIDTSKNLNMYRQPYCGCIYSEQERYDKSLRQKKI